MTNQIQIPNIVIPLSPPTSHTLYVSYYYIDCPQNSWLKRISKYCLSAISYHWGVKWLDEIVCGLLWYYSQNVNTRWKIMSSQSFWGWRILEIFLTHLVRYSMLTTPQGCLGIHMDRFWLSQKEGSR